MWDRIKRYVHDNKRFILIAFVVCMIWSLILAAYKEYTKEEIKEIEYTEFVQMCKDGKVDTVYYSKSKEYMTITLFNKETKKMSKKEREDYKYKAKDTRKVLYPGYDEFRKDMLSYGVNLSIVTSSSAEEIVSALISLAIPIIWILLLWRLMQTQSKPFDKKLIIQTSDVRFDSVIGQDEVIEDIEFIVKLIKDPSISDKIGVRVPKGVLLTGPPGTGKTLIAKAIAGEAGVPFISVSGSDFKEIYVGNGAKKVRELFKIARESAPCILFIDEIDSVGAKRDSNKSNSEDDQTINALLKEMDGFSGRDGIFILAATNYPDHLDDALIRAGRFDRRITINAPRDWQVRKELFKHYLSDYKLSDDVDIDTLSKTVSGFTGADIAMICNEAGIIAMMKDMEYVDQNCLEEAIDKKIFHGNRSKTEAFKKDKEIVAYHESGHAVMTYLLGQPIARASIIGTTSGVGGAVFRQDTDSCFMTDKEMREHIMIAYAGRASEEIKFEIVTTGAANDISQATEAIMSYIERYGFNKEFGLLDMRIMANQRIIDNAELTNRMSEMSNELYKETWSTLKENYELVEVLAQKLLECETLSGPDIKSLLDGVFYKEIL